jgi:hypothetical protein
MNTGRPAHWGIFIPTTGSATKGKMIHVVGNPATGFTLEFKRNYNIGQTTRAHELVELCQVADNLVNDAVSDGTPSADTIGRD